jgi:CheY-like chemotaxis protein
MAITITVFIVLSIILLFFLNIAAREMFYRLKEMKKQAEREEALAESLRLDFTRESKTLKRVEVEEPKARILCVDDEEVVLDSFRKILVMDGYSVDTVETGQEALGLVQTRDYDFVFTDLKMPAMPGVEVAKSVKHLRPDIDVVIITGYATVESAVEVMKHGAMDYVEKPFTEDELSKFTRHALIRRQDRISRQLKPRVQVMGPKETGPVIGREFSIPGGVLVSSGHCWASIADDGTAKVGLDDFARKLIGHIDAIEFPQAGASIRAGQPLFAIRQGERRIRFRAPISGQVVKVNERLGRNCARLDETSYGRNWICMMAGDDLDAELPDLKIGKSAVALFHEDIDRFQAFVEKMGGGEPGDPASLCIGAFEKLDDSQWDKAVSAFFKN